MNVAVSVHCVSGNITAEVKPLDKLQSEFDAVCDRISVLQKELEDVQRNKSKLLRELDQTIEREEQLKLKLESQTQMQTILLEQLQYMPSQSDIKEQVTVYVT